jgi:hypothetical protein
MHSVADLKKFDDGSFNGVVELDEPGLDNSHRMYGD